MTAPFMRAYTEQLVRTCHAHGAFAIGGMAAFIPSRRDAEVNARALAKVREDKQREADDGFDGSWVAHPDLVPVCTRRSTRSWATRPNQLDVTREDVVPGRPALIDLRRGRRPTEAGLRNDVSVGLRYLARMAGRQRCRGDRQPDGGRRDGRDLPLADLAVGARRRRARHRRRP